MKSLWQISLENKNNQIFYDITHEFSPYAEAIGRNLFSESLGESEKSVAVNPFYTHEKIFLPILKEEFPKDFVSYFCDLLLQHIGEIDLYAGMTYEEFLVRFVADELEQGAVGKKELYQLFTMQEKRKIARYYLKLLNSGEYTFYFTAILTHIFKNASVHEKQDGCLLIYIREKKDEIKLGKLEFLIYCFLETYRIYHIFWEYPPYIIGSKLPLGSYVVF